MSAREIVRVGSLQDVMHFRTYVGSLGLTIPCDQEIARGPESPLGQPLERNGIKISNRIAINPMEGWDGTAAGGPTENTLRRWQRFGCSGAKLIWGCEAVAVRHEGRANPHQLLLRKDTQEGIARLRSELIGAHQKTSGSTEGLLIGLQLTHSGRYCRPNEWGRAEPRILYHHPILDRRLKLPSDYPVLSDAEIGSIIEDFHEAARLAWNLGFDFVDIKHCHGYLGHEFLSAHTRKGRYGGSFENRTRFLREVVQGIRSVAPDLKIGVRLSAFDTIPFLPDPAQSTPGKIGPGIPESGPELIPYRWGFGVDAQSPTDMNLAEVTRFLSLLEELAIGLVNITGGSPYYNPHIQRPTLFPPSDGYQPPEDPLIGVARHMDVVRRLKQQFPQLIIVGTGYSYLQDFLPQVAQAALREGWVDSVGLGRMVLAYPDMLWDALHGRKMQRKRVCRTFSDCTSAPRNALPSGCYPLDNFYKDSEWAQQLKETKQRK